MTFLTLNLKQLPLWPVRKLSVIYTANMKESLNMERAQIKGKDMPTLKHCLSTVFFWSVCYYFDPKHQQRKPFT